MVLHQVIDYIVKFKHHSWSHSGITGVHILNQAAEVVWTWLIFFFDHWAWQMQKVSFFLVVHACNKVRNDWQYGALQRTVWVVKVVFVAMDHFAGVSVWDILTCSALCKCGTRRLYQFLYRATSVNPCTKFCHDNYGLQQMAPRFIQVGWLPQVEIQWYKEFHILLWGTALLLEVYMRRFRCTLVHR